MKTTLCLAMLMVLELSVLAEDARDPLVGRLVFVPHAFVGIRDDGGFDIENDIADFFTDETTNQQKIILLRLAQDGTGSMGTYPTLPMEEIAWHHVEEVAKQAIRITDPDGGNAATLFYNAISTELSVGLLIYDEMPEIALMGAFFKTVDADSLPSVDSPEDSDTDEGE